MPNIPAAMNLSSNVIAIPSRLFSEPPEGRRSVTQIIDWAVPIARGLTAVHSNLQDNSTLKFSQICGIIVDNSDCGSDLDFIFPDTDVTISIPAYTPYTVLQVLTNQVMFYTVAAGVIPGDITRFSILNYAPAPVAVPISIQQLSANFGSIPITGADATQIVAAGINGSLRGLSISAVWNSAAVQFNNLFTLTDGAGSDLWQGNIAGPTPSSANYLMVDLSNLSVRFLDGLQLRQQGGSVVGGTLDVNLYYRVP